MPVLDVFNHNAFSMASLSSAVDLVERVPNQIGALGIFTPNPIRTDIVGVERRAGKLQVIQTSQRAAPIEDLKPKEKRKLVHFQTPRLVKKDTILASELQFIREMGTEQAVISVQQEIARRLTGPNGLMADMETTFEHHRLGAIQGRLLDADDSEIYDYYERFGIDEPSAIDFDLANVTDGGLRLAIQKKVVRAMKRLAKGMPFSGVNAFCGDDFWDGFIMNPEVRKTYEGYSAAAELRGSYDDKPFSFGGVNWINYQGTDDNSTVAIDPNKVRFVPAGNSGYFENVWSPGESFDDVGTLGKETYLKVIPDTKREEKVELELYSYPLHFPRRPEVLLHGIK